LGTEERGMGMVAFFRDGEHRGMESEDHGMMNPQKSKYGTVWTPGMAYPKNGRPLPIFASYFTLALSTFYYSVAVQQFNKTL